jgi:predicted enzyme related to lactoylglutathione lyase
MNAKLISLSILGPAVAETTAFYEKLTGQSFAPTMHEKVGHGAWASAGVKFVVMESANNWSGVMASFRVDNLDAALKLATGSGCTVVQQGIKMDLPAGLAKEYENLTHEIGLLPRQDIASTLGTAAIVKDPSGNLISLVELHPHAETHYEEGDISAYAKRYQAHITPRVAKIVAAAKIK